MGVRLSESTSAAIAPRWGSLPPRMRVLLVTTVERTGGWLAEAFAADSSVGVVLEESLSPSAALTRLRETVFDAVLVSHEPAEIDALEFVSAVRSSGAEEPLLVLGTLAEQDFASQCYEVGADEYVNVHDATTRRLIWQVARAIERHTLLRENQRLLQAEKHRLRLEHQEAQRLLDDQRALVRELETIHDPSNNTAEWSSPASSMIARLAAAPATISLPPQLIVHYRDLLRAYVMMGSGNLTRELTALAHVLCGASISVAQTMQLHLQALEELVRGLGSRSARHVMTRADLLILEVLIHLGEGYRQRLVAPPKR